jgi:hypothetical protein
LLDLQRAIDKEPLDALIRRVDADIKVQQMSIDRLELLQLIASPDWLIYPTEYDTRNSYCVFRSTILN